jgi:hypothetical protein
LALPPPKPQGGVPGTGHGGRRTMMFLVIGAVLLVATFLIAVGVVSLIFIRHPNTSVSSPSVKDLPHELALCDHFKPGNILLLDLGKGERHYQVSGECPTSALALRDVYVAELEYIGWTVHDDGSGNLSCYSYDHGEVLNAGITDSSNGDNQSSLSVELITGVGQPPDGFPQLRPSPSPSPSPSAHA